MLRFHQSESSSAAKLYYAKSDYYLEGGQETIGEWGGRAASLLGLKGQVDRSSFERLCDNLHPLTGEQLTARTREDRTVGNDITFDCPKSVSVLYELTQDARIRDAFRRSVQETMRELEAEAKTRVRKGGADSDRATGNLVWASFYHSCSRPVDGASAPDMNMHAHCFAFNITRDFEEKQWKAVQFRDLRRDAPYWEAAFQQRLAVRLEHLGFEVTRKGRYFDLDGVPQNAIGKFSRRTKLIEEEARTRGITDPEEKGQLGAQDAAQESQGAEPRTAPLRVGLATHQARVRRAGRRQGTRRGARGAGSAAREGECPGGANSRGRSLLRAALFGGGPRTGLRGPPLRRGRV